MTAMTKATVCEWEGTTTDFERVDGIDAKIAELQAQGLTDGYQTTDEFRVFTRHWVDQEAAQNWINWATEHQAKYGITLVSANIVDI